MAKDRPLANDFVTDEEFDVLLDAWFGNAARVLEPGRSFYIWGGYANCANYPPFLKKHELYFSQAIIWDKQHPVLTRKDFMGAHEWCQPPETLVATAHGQVPIDTLSDGDSVISFNSSTSELSEAAVTVTSRYYDGPLYQVIVDDHATWCTPEHLWTVRTNNCDDPIVVTTLDLEPDEMQLPVPNGTTVEWRTLDDVDTDLYLGKVYSMAVAHDEHYVADGIVTHNCFYGWKAGAAHKFYGPNNATDLWHLKKVTPQNMIHLTEKPAELAVRAIQYSSAAGENVLDLFGGSGSTLIGAEQTGRNAYLMELDTLYCDVIADPFQRFSGKPAVLERTGTSPIPMGVRDAAMR